MITQTANIQVCPSKSMSHRLGICAALADGTSTLENNLDCADTRRTAGVLAAAGAVVLAKGKGACGARKLEIHRHSPRKGQPALLQRYPRILLLRRRFRDNMPIPDAGACGNRDLRDTLPCFWQRENGRETNRTTAEGAPTTRMPV